MIFIYQLAENGGNIHCVDWWEVGEWALAGLGVGELGAAAFEVEAAEALAAEEAGAAETAGEAGEAEACAGGSCESPDGCFSAETTVATATGQEAIDDVKPGDLVWSKDDTTGMVALHRVVKRFVTPGEALLDLDVAADDGTSEMLRATPTHRFWVDGQGWTFAGDLRAGDRLDLRSGNHAAFVRAEREAELTTVFNLEIEDAHSYFVGEEGVWVHNGCPPANESPPGAGRSGAFNEAKRQNGIPTSQQPTQTGPNLDRGGNLQPGRSYEFDVPARGGGTRNVVIRDDAGGHDFGAGDPQNRGPHFNDPSGRHYDY